MNLFKLNMEQKQNDGRIRENILDTSACGSICKSLMIAPQSHPPEPLPLLRLLPRSPPPFLPLIFTMSILLLLSWLVLLQLSFSRFGPPHMVCFEHIYQFPCCRQLGFRHPRVLSPDSILPFKADQFLASDFADFPLVIGVCNCLGFLEVGSPVSLLGAKVRQLLRKGEAIFHF